MTQTGGKVLSFTEKLAEARKKVEAEKAKREAAQGNRNPAGFDFSADIPDLDDEPVSSTELRQDQKEFNEYIRGYNIVELYNRWKPSDRPAVNFKGNVNHKARCPNPTHADKKASFGMHAGKNQWNCGTCGGGDNIALYALTQGIDPDYLKNNSEEFRRVVLSMATELGVKQVDGISETYYLVPGSGFAPPAPAQESKEEEEVEDNVTVLPTISDSETEDQNTADEPSPEIDWRSFVPPGTFLWEWLVSATKDTCPEEYHVWTGLMAIGFALGRDVSLLDQRPVYGNLAVCLVGPTGAGKSRAAGLLPELLVKTMPDEYGRSQFVRQIGEAGSGEYLLHEFDNTMVDPTKTLPPMRVDVRGLAMYDEFSSFMSKSNQKGSTLRQAFMKLSGGDKYATGGSLTGGKIKVENPFFQILSTTQGKSLSGLVSKSDDDSGFLNRWVFASGKMKERKIWGGTPVDLTVPSAMFQNLLDWSRDPRLMLIEGTPAMEVYADKFFPLIVKNENKLDAQGSSMGSRLEIYAKKLVLLFAANMMPDTNEVPVEAVEQAIKIFEYLAASTVKTDVEINRTSDSVLMERIMHTINLFAEKKRQPPTANEIRRNNTRYFKTIRELVEILDNMKKVGMVSVIAPSSARGNAQPRYEAA